MLDLYLSGMMATGTVLLLRGGRDPRTAALVVFGFALVWPIWLLATIHEALDP